MIERESLEERIKTFETQLPQKLKWASKKLYQGKMSTADCITYLAKQIQMAINLRKEEKKNS